MRPTAHDANRLRERGLTLVELLVGVLLLSFLSLGSASLLGVILQQNNLSEHRSLATGLATERVEHLLALPFRGSSQFTEYRLPSETATTGPPATLAANYGSIPGYPEFRRVVTLNYDVPSTGMLQVITDVYWRDVRQGEKRHRLITYVHPGLEQGS